MGFVRIFLEVPNLYDKIQMNTRLNHVRCFYLCFGPVKNMLLSYYFKHRHTYFYNATNGFYLTKSKKVRSSVN